MYPILFTFKLFGRTISIYSYGLFLLLGLAAAILLFYWLLKKRKISTEKIFDNILWTVLAGLLGARIFYVLFHLRFYLGNPREMFRFWYGGLDFFGAMFGGLLAFSLWLYIRKRKEIWSFFDCAAVVMFLGHAIGMIGSLMVGSDLGRPTDLPIGIKFAALDNISRHPTQIYESLLYLLIFFVLLFLFEKTHHASGFIFFVGLILFGFARFVVEFFRLPDVILWKGIWDNTLAHLLSFIVLVAGVIGMRLHGEKHVRSLKS